MSCTFCITDFLITFFQSFSFQSLPLKSKEKNPSIHIRLLKFASGDMSFHDITILIDWLYRQNLVVNVNMKFHIFRTGKLPRKKYMNICPNASRSSRRLCSIEYMEIYFHDENYSLWPFPRWVLMLIYLAVPNGIWDINIFNVNSNKPVRLLCSRNGICRPVSGSMYSLAKPKSIMWIICCFFVDERPMRKFSGFTLDNKQKSTKNL